MSVSTTTSLQRAQANTSLTAPNVEAVQQLGLPLNCEGGPLHPAAANEPTSGDCRYIARLKQRLLLTSIRCCRSET